MSLPNTSIAELLAVASKSAPYPILQKALRRVSRRAPGSPPTDHGCSRLPPSSTRLWKSTDLLRLAAEAGCRISIGTDAHGPTQLPFIALGLASALRAGVRRDRILNFLPVEELLTWVREIRRS